MRSALKRLKNQKKKGARVVPGRSLAGDRERHAEVPTDIVTSGGVEDVRIHDEQDDLTNFNTEKDESVEEEEDDDSVDLYSSSGGGGSVLWSCIARDGTILVEAGNDPYGGGQVAQTAKDLLKRKNTPGYEYHSSSNSKLLNKHVRFFRKPKIATSNHGEKLRGIKFHLYDRCSDDCSQGKSSSPKTLRVWVFAAVYDTDRCSLQQVKSFLDKIVKMTEPFRMDDYIWKEGTTLACQDAFASVLLKSMNEITYLGRMCILHDHISESKSAMENNIEILLEREEQLCEIQEQYVSQVNDISKHIYKSTKDLRRMKMMQYAKHGSMMGATITAGIAVVVIPFLLAVL